MSNDLVERLRHWGDLPAHVALLDSTESIFDQGNRHKSGKKPFDYLIAWLSMLRPFAFATKDDSWGEMEKLICVVMRNYVEVRKDAGQAAARITALEAENFMLAAGACINPGQHGLVGDEGGNSVCTAHEAYLAAEQELADALASKAALEAQVARLERENERVWRERNLAVTKVKAWEDMVFVEGLPVRAVRCDEWGPGEGEEVAVPHVTPRKLTELLNELEAVRAALGEPDAPRD